MKVAKFEWKGTLFEVRYPDASGPPLDVRLPDNTILAIDWTTPQGGEPKATYVRERHFTHAEISTPRI